MAALSFDEAFALVLERTRHLRRAPARQRVRLAEAAGRVLAQDITADRDQPPAARSTRDGFAVRAEDLPGVLRIAGEARAGVACAVALQPGETIETMTGAVLPAGADTVVMVEHARVAGDRVEVGTPLEMGANVCGQGADARAGDGLLGAGVLLGYRELALAAALGVCELDVYARPRVAIVATGDELVEVDETPAVQQVRNSNSVSLAVQVTRAGGEAVVLPVARDCHAATRAQLLDGLRCDLLLISGGVSAGRYDVVEPVLQELGAEFYFDRVKIQPGQPCVFGQARGVPFFGLPGNPASTMVCFEIFARAALELLAGCAAPSLRRAEAPLAVAFRHKPGLTRFLPAWLGADGRLTPVRWSGSGDLAGLARANCYLVAASDKGHYAAGERIGVLWQ